jgi:imidazolonepropionase-like amidohydrolase
MVASHAEGLAGIQLSVKAGVDTLEHGEMAFGDTAILAEMAERGIILVPTLCVFDLVAGGEAFPEWMRERAKFLRESAEKTVAAARQEGVSLAMGADAGPHGENARELVRLVETGLSPMEGIVAATKIAARACGIETKIGTVEAAKVADLLVLDGDPLENVRVFLDAQRRWLVLQAGEPVAGTRASAPNPWLR